MQKLVSEIGNILTAPFVGQVDLIHLFLIVGLVIIFAAAWYLILYHMRSAAAELI